MTPVEIMALVVVVVSVIKLVVTLINPQIWMRKVARGVYGNKQVTAIVCLVLGAVTFYYLLQELSIVQIFAAFLAFWFVFILAVLPFGRDIVSAVETKYTSTGEVWRRSWLVVVIWIVLLVWVVKELFM
jgi:hypothetical protein